MIRGCAWAILVTASTQVFPVPASDLPTAEDMSISWVSTTALGLQRGFTHSRKITEAPPKRVDVEQAKMTGIDDALSLALEADDALTPTWLENTALGLQRGLEVKQAPVVVPTNIGTGLQRGFYAEKEKSQIKQAAKKLPQVPVKGNAAAMTLGLQRGFTMQKKSVVLVDADAANDAHPTPAVVPTNAEPGLQRGTFAEKESPIKEAAKNLPQVDMEAEAAAMTLGLQRSFTVQKKNVVLFEAESARETPQTPVVVLSNVEPGLQRGFRVEKAKSPNTEAAKKLPQEPANVITAAMTLGLQRGFQTQKQKVVLVDADVAKEASQPKAEVLEFGNQTASNVGRDSIVV